MAYNEAIVLRIRKLLDAASGHIREKKMFGGLSFLYKGKMSIGVMGNEILVRVVADKMEETLQQPAVKPMAFTGKPMKEFVMVEEAGFQTDQALSTWIALGIEHAEQARGKT